MLNRTKSYEIKEWKQNEICELVQRNLTMCDIFAVLKETEKAIYAMLDIGNDRCKSTWIPKSALIECEIGEDPETGMNHPEILFEADYDKALVAFRQMCADHR